jgi:hypothetical protein
MKDDIDQSIMKLTGFYSIGGDDEKDKEVVFEVMHNNGVTTLEQHIILHKDKRGNWTATVQIDEFPDMDTPEEAAQKLADWLHRIAKVIKQEYTGVIKLGDV